MPAKPFSDSDQPHRRASRLVVMALAALSAFALAHGITWYVLSTRLQDGFDEWSRSRREVGWRIQYQPTLRGGWPFAIHLTIPDLRIEGGEGAIAGGMAWESPRLVLRLAPPFLDRLVAEPRGPQILRLADAVYPFAADRIEIALPFEPGAPLRHADLQGERLRIGLATGPFELRGFSLRAEATSSATADEPALSVALTMTGIDLPPQLLDPRTESALGRHIASFAVNGTLSGPIAYDADLAPRAEAWRESGGTLELTNVAAEWGSLRGAARMTLTLDDALQPMGAGQVQLIGATEALDALALAGSVSPRAAQAARLAVGVLAQRRDGQGPQQLRLPLLLQDRYLRLGPILLLRFAPLAWPVASDDAPEAADPTLPALR